MTTQTADLKDNLAPRKGFFLEQLDSLVGPGATRAELLLQFGASIVIGIGCMLLFQETQPDASWYQKTAVALLGMDMVGGVVTNSTSAAKRWYHRPGQGFQEHMTFICIHALQIAAVSFQFVTDEEEKWVYFGLVYGFLLVSSTIVLTVPLYIQRPVAMALAAAAIPGSMSRLVPQTPGLEWFLPLLFLKLLVSHLTQETPFRASSQQKAKNL